MFSRTGGDFLYTHVFIFAVLVGNFARARGVSPLVDYVLRLREELLASLMDMLRLQHDHQLRIRKLDIAAAVAAAAAASSASRNGSAPSLSGSSNPSSTSALQRSILLVRSLMEVVSLLLSKGSWNRARSSPAQIFLRENIDVFGRVLGQSDDFLLQALAVENTFLTIREEYNEARRNATLARFASGVLAWQPDKDSKGSARCTGVRPACTRVRA